MFGRIATIAGTWRLDVAPLLDRLSVLAPELGDFAMVWVPHTFDRVAVSCSLSRKGDSLDRARALAEPEQLARVHQLAGSETRELNVEAETTGGDAIAIAFQAFGRRDAGIDLERLASFGVSAGARATLSAVLDALGGRLVAITDHSDAHWTLQVEHANRSDADRADTRARLDVAATALAVSSAQRNLIAGLHDSFAHDRASYATVEVRRDGVANRLGVVWAGVAWEHVVRMMLQFYPGATSQRLGELAGAFDAEAAAAVELILGPSEPPQLRVAVTHNKGRT